MLPVNSIGYDITNHEIFRHPVANKFAIGLAAIGNKLGAIALPVLGLVSLSFLPKAEAGPGAYGACLTACISAGVLTGPAGMCCIACCCAEACAPLLLTPTP
jgi:hypothetical protein